jgi:hypothetical protein
MYQNGRTLLAYRPMAAVPLVVVSIALLTGTATTRASTPQRVPESRPALSPEAWTGLSADVTLNQGLLDKDGQPVGRPVPASRYRWVRKKTNGRWKTTLTVLSGTRPPARFLSGATREIEPAVATIEDDGDGKAPRFYDKQKRRIQPPQATDIKPLNTPAFSEPLELPRLPAGIADVAASRLADGGWTRSLVLSRQDGKARRTEAERRFGPALGKVSGLDQFVTATDDGTLEVLVDPDAGVIREWNLVKNGTLEAHSTSTYDAIDGELLVRRAARVERLMPNGSGNRMATQVDLENVRVERR